MPVEIGFLYSNTLFQHDAFHALMSLHAPRRADPQRKHVRKRRQPLPHRGSFLLFPMGALMVKPSRGRELLGQVYDNCSRHWRVRCKDNDWEELSPREMEELVKKGQGGCAT